MGFHKYIFGLVTLLYCVTVASGYTVQSGGTLEAIAQNELGNASRWLEIDEANQIAEPYVITSGNTIILPDLKNKTAIEIPEDLSDLTDLLSKLDTTKLSESIGALDFFALREKIQPMLDTILTPTVIIVTLVVVVIWSVVGWMIYAFFLWLSCIMMSIVCTFRDAMRISMNASIITISVLGFVALCTLGMYYLTAHLGAFAVMAFGPPLMLFFSIFYLKCAFKIGWLKSIGLMIIWSVLPTFLNSGIGSILYGLTVIVSGFSQL